VHGGEVQRGLVGVAGRLAHRGKQQRAACDGLQPARRMRRPAVPAPPVVDQRTGTGHGLAAVDVLRGEATQPHWFFSSSKAFSASARSR
jgi:hypothetical protein